MKKVIRELLSWSKLRHKHVLGLIGIIVDANASICLISPWNSNASANKFLGEKPPEIIMNVVSLSNMRIVTRADYKRDRSKELASACGTCTPNVLFTETFEG